MLTLYKYCIRFIVALVPDGDDDDDDSDDAYVTP